MSRTPLRYSELASPVTITSAVIGAYLWLHTPALQQYSLQAFAACTLLSLILKRFKRAKIYHLLPGNNSAEIGLLTFAFLLLIGATGNTTSPFFSLGYVHLFFIVMTSGATTAILATTAVLCFHIGLSPVLSPEVINNLITLPLLLLFFLFAKRQYDEARADRHIIEQDAAAYEKLQNQEQSLEVFLQQFLQPKLLLLEELAKDNTQLSTLKSQLSLLQSEITKLLERKQNDRS